MICPAPCRGCEPKKGWVMVAFTRRRFLAATGWAAAGALGRPWSRRRAAAHCPHRGHRPARPTGPGCTACHGIHAVGAEPNITLISGCRGQHGRRGAGRRRAAPPRDRGRAGPGPRRTRYRGAAGKPEQATPPRPSGSVPPSSPADDAQSEPRTRPGQNPCRAAPADMTANPSPSAPGVRQGRGQRRGRRPGDGVCGWFRAVPQPGVAGAGGSTTVGGTRM